MGSDDYAHHFGGQWTEEKLDTLRKYLEAYRQIFTKNPNAQFFTTTYVDAFAGTGHRSVDDDALLASHLSSPEDAQGFRQGSARIALELSTPFSEYVFIEKNAEHAEELARLKKEYPDYAERITIYGEDANDILVKFCAERNWRKERAVVFLDPYGMQVEWPTIESIARTRAIDMWLLFPLGQAVNRLLTRNRLPTEGSARRLTKTFGTDAWKEAFYKENTQGSLFETDTQYVKDTDFDGIAQFFIERLRTVFADVAPNYRLLYNSKNVPIYMLCFAAANERGAKPAIRIANSLLKPQ